MRWGDVDLDDRWWTIPGSGTKNSLPHRVPLNDLAIEILTALHRRVPEDPPASGYVLAGARGKRQRSETSARIGLDDFRGHDLRRTAASRMASAGVPRLVIGRILNHVESDVTAVYDRHGYDAEKRNAFDIWARELKEILARSQEKGPRKNNSLEAAVLVHRAHRTRNPRPGPMNPYRT